ncbi:VCBS repeat-containing protein [candidate division KSB1 bacterium]|nr:VCBS repeat-containing protein [candidate division KSB1 bacterium]
MFGIALQAQDDINGDGYNDIVVRDTAAVLVYFGGPALDDQPDVTLASTGTVIASNGDINGDDFHDIIVGNPNYNSGCGKSASILVAPYSTI